MNFSELLKQSYQLCKFASNGQFVAIAYNACLFVRDVKSLQVCQAFTCVDAIDNLEWSSDSRYILCGMLKRRIVQVWSLEEPEWTCKIDEGSLGLTDVCWSPDARHVLTISKFHLRITIWSLLNKSVSYIKYAKAANPGLEFSPDGKYMAVAERRDGRDYISIFVCSMWKLVKHFKVDTRDLDGILWSPDGQVICAWEKITEDYKVVIYSMDECCLGSYSAYSWSLGVKSVKWSPSGQFLAVGSYDQKVRLLNNITWKPIDEFDHPANIYSTELIVYNETEDVSPALISTACVLGTISNQSKYEIKETRPVQIPAIALDPNKPYPKHGIGMIAFSSDSSYFACVNDNMPTALWIWNIKKLMLSDVLLQQQAIKCFEWDPCRLKLAICTGMNKLFLWSPSGCLSIKTPFPEPLQIQSLKWHPFQDLLLLLGKENLCFCFLS